MNTTVTNDLNTATTRPNKATDDAIPTVPFPKSRGSIAEKQDASNTDALATEHQLTLQPCQQGDIPNGEDVSIVIKVQSTEIVIAVNQSDLSVEVFDTSPPSSDDGITSGIDDTVPSPASDQSMTSEAAVAAEESSGKKNLACMELAVADSCRSGEIHASPVAEHFLPSVSVSMVPVSPRDENNENHDTASLGERRTGMDSSGCQLSPFMEESLVVRPADKPRAKMTFPAVNQLVDLTFAAGDDDQNDGSGADASGRGRPSDTDHKLVVDITGQTRQPGNQPCKKMLVQYGRAFLRASEQQKSDIIVTHFINGFVFQKPVQDNVLTLGTASTVRMLSKALTEAGRRLGRRDDENIAKTAQPRCAVPTTLTHHGIPASAMLIDQSNGTELSKPESKGHANLPVVYCTQNAFDESGRKAFAHAVQSAKVQYRNSDRAGQASILEAISTQFQFLVRCEEEKWKWIPACPLVVRQKIRRALSHAFGRTGTTCASVQTQPAAKSRDAEKAILLSVQQPVPQKKLVVHCGRGTCFKHPGNIAYNTFVSSVETLYNTGSSSEHRDILVDLFLKRFEFQKEGQPLEEPFVRQMIQRRIRDCKRDAQKRKAEEIEVSSIERLVRARCDGENLSQLATKWGESAVSSNGYQTTAE